RLRPPRRVRPASRPATSPPPCRPADRCTAATRMTRDRTAARSTRLSGSGPVLFGKFRVLGKLRPMVGVPLPGRVGLSIAIVIDRISAARDAQNTSNVVALATRVSSAVQELQSERILSVGFEFGLVQEPELAVQTARAVDAVARIDDGSGVPKEM